MSYIPRNTIVLDEVKKLRSVNLLKISPYNKCTVLKISTQNDHIVNYSRT